MNPAAEVILGIDASSVLGLQAKEAISGWPEFQEYLESDPPDRMVDLPCHRDGSLRYYAVIRTPLPVHRGRGSILIIQDITAQKEAEQGMKTARTHISLLNSITRHDILNLVTGASGYLQLIQMDPSHPDVPRYLQNLESTINGIQREIEFTRDCQEMGTAPPEWQTVVPLIYSCLEKNHLDDEIDVEVDLPRTLAVYADHMLEKVFCNIIRNAGQHAEGMTRLRIFSIARPDTRIWCSSSRTTGREFPTRRNHGYLNRPTNGGTVTASSWFGKFSPSPGSISGRRGLPVRVPGSRSPFPPIGSGSVNERTGHRSRRRYSIAPSTGQISRHLPHM